MANAALQALLERTNPWLGEAEAVSTHARGRLPEVLVPRTAAPELAAALEDTRRAHLVIGPRQAGKSSLIWSLLAERPTPLLYLNCEEPLIREWCSSPGLFAGDVGAWLPEGGLIFFEEAQWLNEAGLFLKGLIDARTGRRVVVTGSASFHLLSKTRESLAGRATRHHVWPFCLDEVAPFDPARLLAAHRRDARVAMERQLIFGGYPDAWMSKNPRPVLDELVAAFVLRDASDRFHIERPDAFRLLLRLMAGQAGDLVNYAEWSRILGVAATTVADYVALLEETHVVRCVRPFIGGKRAELTQAPKVFFVDNGLRNALAGGFEPLDRRGDIGKLLENWVFSELHKRFPEPAGIRYWRTRTGTEVDFVLEPEAGRVMAIEVKAAGAPRPNLARSTRSFLEAYAPAVTLLVHRGESFVEKIGQTEVRFVPAELLPRALAEL